jgi:hypothetical protein
MNKTNDKIKINELHWILWFVFEYEVSTKIQRTSNTLTVPWFFIFSKMKFELILVILINLWNSDRLNNGDPLRFLNGAYIYLISSNFHCVSCFISSTMGRVQSIFIDGGGIKLA